MKKYTTGFLVLGMMLAGVAAMPNKAVAGPMPQSVINSIIQILQNAGASTSTNASITGILSSPTATGGTTTTTTTTTNVVIPCAPSYTYNILTGQPCPPPSVIVPPTTLGGTYTTTTTSTTNTTTGGTTTVGTTPNTTTTTTTNTTNTQPNYCISNYTAQYAYNIQNGYQCVKVCPSLVTANSVQSSAPLWNAVTNSICPSVVITPPLTPSITVLHPNGAEIFNPGDVIVVKWETQNISSTNNQVFVLLNYYTPAGAFITNTQLVNGYTVNDGNEEVKLPTDLPLGATWGNNFTVTIGVLNTSDTSDKNFTVQ